MKNLPIGIQTFENIRSKTANFIYVDKTDFVYEIAQNTGSYFLSRPRRFGKSLFLGTLKSLFQGKKELFEGLYIYDKWDWSQTFPVIHFSFDALNYRDRGLDTVIFERINDIAEQYDIFLVKEDYKSRFEELLHKVSKKHGKVVFLVDEYDKPIIDFLEYQQDGTFPQAVVNQGIMKGFYSVLKGNEASLQLTFITGISKFSKVSVFSDLNHLQDLTLLPQFAKIVGYTQEEVELHFDEHIEATRNNLELDKETFLNQMKIWYNGFSWNGKDTLYNPFGLLTFFNTKEFRNFWFTTGTPTFLLNQMKIQEFYDVENTTTEIEELDSYDIHNLNLIPLLFQTGYLTIKSKNVAEGTLLLDYPNKEVRESMYRFMINGLAPNPRRASTANTIKNLIKAFQQADLEGVRKILSSLLADLPSEVYDKKSEELYHGLLHFIFSLIGVYVKSEVHSSQGRADSIVETTTHVYIFEFKFNRSANEALAQIKEKKYADRYQSASKIILGIGVNFVTKDREIQGWETEIL